MRIFTIAALELFQTRMTTNMIGQIGNTWAHNTIFAQSARYIQTRIVGIATPSLTPLPQLGVCGGVQNGQVWNAIRTGTGVVVITVGVYWRIVRCQFLSRRWWCQMSLFDNAGLVAEVAAWVVGFCCNEKWILLRKLRELPGPSPTVLRFPLNESFPLLL